MSNDALQEAKDKVIALKTIIINNLFQQSSSLT